MNQSVLGFERQVLVFNIDGEWANPVIQSTKAMVESLAGARDWLAAAPRFVLDVEQGVLGGALEILTVEHAIQLGLELPQFREVEFLVLRLMEFSRIDSVSIELELDNVYVGAIDDGIPDSALKAGLIAEWGRRLRVDVASELT